MSDPTLSRRDFLKLSGAALLTASLSRFQPAFSAFTSPPTIYRGSARHRYLALTYDDCYLVKRMQDLEEMLAQYPKFHVTLFPVGTALLNNETKDPGIWKRFYEKGHEIGYHSFDHTNLAVMSPKSALADFDKWSEALTRVLGERPNVRFARPPYGVISHPFEILCNERGLVATLWSTGWGGPPDSGLKAARESRNGDIVLLHIRTDDIRTTAQALPYLAEQGIGAVTLARLYDDLLREQNQSEGCEVGAGSSLTRTCIE